MKALLLHREKNFDFGADIRVNAETLTQDLELATLFDAMAGEDAFVRKVVERVILTKDVPAPDDVRYRQEALKDCLSCQPVVRQIYDLAIEALESERKIHFGVFRDSPYVVLHRSVEILTMFVGMLKRLRAIVDAKAAAFQSRAFSQLFQTLRQELSDDYFVTIERHLKRLAFRGGVALTARLGPGNKGADYILRNPLTLPGWLDWLLTLFTKRPEGFTYQLHPRDEAGANALSRLRDRGLALAAQAVAEASSHVLNFFTSLRHELAFYLGCVQLSARLKSLGCTSCLPEPMAKADCRFSCAGLYDVCLALHMNRPIVGNTIAAAGRRLIVVTGANQGGKSTFLRSVGLAQLMMQAGMFVAAESLAANIVSGVFTHYKREEDSSMSSGKFDEELGRMSGLVDQIRPHALILFNESFASTNEREGSEIARQIVTALLEAGSKVVFVTHMFELADHLYREPPQPALFLRAPRDDQGRRSFQLVEGEPSPTSYGEDLYAEIFAEA